MGRKTGRTDRALLQPKLEHLGLRDAGMQFLGEGEIPAAVEFPHAREHRRKPAHEEAVSMLAPGRSVDIAGGTQVEESFFPRPAEWCFGHACHRRNGQRVADGRGRSLRRLVGIQVGILAKKIPQIMGNKI